MSHYKIRCDGGRCQQPPGQSQRGTSLLPRRIPSGFFPSPRLLRPRHVGDRNAALPQRQGRLRGRIAQIPRHRLIPSESGFEAFRLCFETESGATRSGVVCASSSATAPSAAVDGWDDIEDLDLDDLDAFGSFDLTGESVPIGTRDDKLNPSRAKSPAEAIADWPIDLPTRDARKSDTTDAINSSKGKPGTTILDPRPSTVAGTMKQSKQGASEASRQGGLERQGGSGGGGKGAGNSGGKVGGRSTGNEKGRGKGGGGLRQGEKADSPDTRCFEVANQHEELVVNYTISSF